MYREINNEGNIGITYQLSRMLYYLGKFKASKDTTNIEVDTFTINAETYAKVRIPLNNPIFLNILNDYLELSRAKNNLKFFWDKMIESVKLFNSVNLNISNCFPKNRCILRKVFSFYFNLIKNNLRKEEFYQNSASLVQFVKQIDDPIIYNEFASILFSFSDYQNASFFLNCALHHAFLSKISMDSRITIQINLCNIYFVEGKFQDCFQSMLQIQKSILNHEKCTQALINMTFFESKFTINLSVDQIPLQKIDQFPTEIKFQIYYFQFINLYYKRDFANMKSKFNFLERIFQQMERNPTNNKNQEFTIYMDLCKMINKLSGGSSITWTEVENEFKKNEGFVRQNCSQEFFLNYQLNKAIILFNNSKFSEAYQIFAYLYEKTPYPNQLHEKKELENYIMLSKFLTKTA